MVEKFQCLEPECREAVAYERDQVKASRIYAPNTEIKKKKKIIYLTCKNAHTHRYEFWDEVYE